MPSMRVVVVVYSVMRESNERRVSLAVHFLIPSLFDRSCSSGRFRYSWDYFILSALFLNLVQCQCAPPPKLRH